MKQSVHGLHGRLVLDMHIVSCLFASLQTIAQIKQCMLNVEQSGVGTVWWKRNGLGRSARLRCRRFRIITFAVYKGMSASSTLDLT